MLWLYDTETIMFANLVAGRCPYSKKIVSTRLHRYEASVFSSILKLLAIPLLFPWDILFMYSWLMKHGNSHWCNNPRYCFVSISNTYWFGRKHSVYMDETHDHSLLKLYLQSMCQIQQFYNFGVVIKREVPFLLLCYIMVYQIRWFIEYSKNI